MTSPHAAIKAPGVMAGGGGYRESSVTQREAGAIGFPLVAAAVDALTAAAGGSSTVALIADFGAASGNNSLRPIAIAIDHMPSGDTSGPTERRAREVLVVHTDLPGNDFRTLFDVIDHDPASYLEGRTGVYPLVAGRSFYDRIFPATSLSFGWSSSSLHWLSAAPGGIPDHFFVHMSHDADCRARYLARSSDDWRRFLHHRSVELVRGGGVVVVDVLRGDDGLMGSEALFDRLAGAIARQRDAGMISAAEYSALVYPTWFRSVAEIREPFDPTFTGTDGSVLELVDLRESVLADPFGDLLAVGRTEGGKPVSCARFSSRVSRRSCRRSGTMRRGRQRWTRSSTPRVMRSRPIPPP
jgi:SAM dependent carboxyl methyltransferase